jgi:hypothetical protein
MGSRRMAQELRQAGTEKRRSAEQRELDAHMSGGVTVQKPPRKFLKLTNP